MPLCVVGNYSWLSHIIFSVKLTWFSKIVHLSLFWGFVDNRWWRFDYPSGIIKKYPILIRKFLIFITNHWLLQILCNDHAKREEGPLWHCYSSRTQQGHLPWWEPLSSAVLETLPLQLEGREGALETSDRVMLDARPACCTGRGGDHAEGDGEQEDSQPALNHHRSGPRI